MLSRFINAIILILFAFTSTAQEHQKCATDYLHKKQIENNPQLLTELKKTEDNLQKFIQNQYFNFRSRLWVRLCS